MFDVYSIDIRILSEQTEDVDNPAINLASIIYNARAEN